MEHLKVILSKIENADGNAMKKCQEILDTRMKPNMSLGVLEELAIKVAGITGKPINTLEKGCHIIASADNGVIAEGISSCPLEYTNLVSEAMLSSYAAIGILCKSLGAELNLIDIGIGTDIKREYENLHRKKVSKGTKNFVIEPAMSEEEVLKAIKVGIDIIEEKKEFDFFSNGEMGIGNTTTSSAILYALTDEEIDLVVGRGGGLSDEGLLKKKKIIKESVEKYDLKNKDIFEVLRHVGGLDIACMVGMYIGAAVNKKPMLIDGFISGVAALVAYKIEPKTKDYMIGTHLSEEPGMRVLIKTLGIDPFLDMKMRLGEGTGAILAYPILKSAMEIPKNMKTKEEIYQIFSI